MISTDRKPRISADIWNSCCPTLPADEKELVGLHIRVMLVLISQNDSSNFFSR